MKTYLLVFDEGNGSMVDLNGYVNTLDDGAEILTLDAHVSFVKSGLPVKELSNRFLKFAGSSLFLITDISKSAYAGRLFDEYWDLIKRDRVLTTAD